MKYLKKQFVYFNNKLKLKDIVCDVYKYCSDKQNVNIFKNKSNNKHWVESNHMKKEKKLI